ncbi:MAG: hypothetical protein DHS80DRAFT_25674 [Piptocephalis tieghemiana]|nr:MAG: hypothetical protein DHS80DRAFT_25674 [Piptocephalis tieghemiana]
MGNGKNTLKKLAHPFRAIVSKKRRGGEKDLEMRRRGKVSRFLDRLKNPLKKRKRGKGGNRFNSRTEAPGTGRRDGGALWRESAVTVVPPSTPPRIVKPEVVQPKRGGTGRGEVQDGYPEQSQTLWRTGPSATEHGHRTMTRDSGTLIDHGDTMSWQKDTPVSNGGALMVGQVTTRPIHMDERMIHDTWRRFYPEMNRNYNLVIPPHRTGKEYGSLNHHESFQSDTYPLVQASKTAQGAEELLDTWGKQDVLLNGSTDPWDDFLLIPRPIVTLAWNACYTYLHSIHLLEWVLSSTVDRTLHLCTAEQVRSLLDPIHEKGHYPTAA